VLNVFQVTGLTAEGRYFTKPSPAKGGDFIEFFAELDVLAALSNCPHGDMSAPVWGTSGGDRTDICRPLRIEIWQPAPELLAGWPSPSPSDYRGGHGFRTPGASSRFPPGAARPRGCARGSASVSSTRTALRWSTPGRSTPRTPQNGWPWRRAAP